MDDSAVCYLGRGIYDIREVARLLRVGRARIEGWVGTHRGDPPLLTGELDGLFSFWDLLSLRVIAELANRGVPRGDIERGASHLSGVLGTSRPFAHEGLATVGVGFFADVSGGWEDVGKCGQLAFQDMVQPLLDPITFDDSCMAAIWRPRQSVWINPAVQAGTPCVDGTRVPTQLLANLLETNKSGVNGSGGNKSGVNRPDDRELHEVCDDYRLTVQQVNAALDYEVALAA